MSLNPPVLPAGVLSLTDVDGVGYVCDTCFAWNAYPNARQRCAQSLDHVMPQSLRGNAIVLATMSAFVAENDV